MTRDDIIRMAREAGFICLLPDEGAVPGHAGIWSDDENVLPQFERFTNLVAAAEREACAKLCEEDGLLWGKKYAEAIRARGKA